ncbi:MAG TPA: hypothetical protein VGR16_13905 [Thermomicrobiales bacterium]|nr:hypothetical protein [Thermomicrobiales bacterium]
MSITTRPLTYDDLIQMPDDGKRYEIVGGELLMSPSPIPIHEELLGRLYAIYAWGGIREYWLADPVARMPLVHALEDDRWIPTRAPRQPGSRALPDPTWMSPRSSRI